MTSTMLCVMPELASITWPKNFVIRKLYDSFSDGFISHADLQTEETKQRKIYKLNIVNIFDKIVINSSHKLHKFLPEKNVNVYRSYII